MRRRLTALGVILAVVVVAFITAYSLPRSTPAPIPDEVAPAAVGGAAQPMAKRIVVARLEGEDLLLPVRQQSSTAIAFHPVDVPNSVAFSPVGDRLGGGDLGTRLADIFADGGGVQYYLMDGDGGDRSPSTAGLDVGSVPGERVFSPVDGRVTAVKTYKLLGRYDDVEIDVQLAADPSLLLVITHVARPAVHVGDEVTAGTTALGVVRDFSSELEQDIQRYTNDGGDHVQMTAVRITPDLAGF
jgi:hypothetical protein